jgi:O-antigen ligase
MGNNIGSLMVKSATNFNWLDLLTKSIPILMGIFIFFNPFPHTTAIKEICYYLSVIIVTILILSKKIDFTFKTPLLLPFGLFILWSFLSIFFAFDKENSIHDVYSHLIRYVILFYILINFYNSEKRLLYLSRIIILSSTVFAIGSLIYFYFILDKSLLGRTNQLNFVQTPVGVIGVTSVFSIILALNYLKNNGQFPIKVLLSFCVLAIFIAMIMTQERSSLLAILLATAVFFYKNKKWMFVFLILMLVISAIFPIMDRLQLFNPRKMYSSAVKNIRIKIDYLTLEVIKEHPIIGIGFGLQSYSKLDLEGYQKRIPKEYRQKKIITDPHNMVLDVAVRLGVIGLGFFFYIIFVFFKMCRSIIKYGKDNSLKNWGICLAACFIGVCTIGLFQPIFSHMPEVVFCIIFSITHVVWQLNNEMISSESKVPKSKHDLFKY